MNDFDFDSLQKKRIARGAYHKKNGSKSKGCTLPSDYLTVAEKRKLNGEVKTVELDKPRTWVEFRAMPDSDKIMYLEFLRSKYKPSARMLAAMFGASRNAVDCECKRLKHDTGYRRGEKVTEKSKADWRVFLGCGVSIPTEEPAAEKAVDATQEVVSEATITQGNITIFGTPRDVMNLLSIMCGSGQRQFRVSFGGEA